MATLPVYELSNLDGVRVSSPQAEGAQVCFIMVWYGMVWYGKVWYGMVWYGTVWYGRVR